MSDVCAVKREPITIKLAVAGRQRIRELAKTETEGNESQMVRKLLTEAIAARDRRAP